MTIITRMSRLFKADFHNMLDHIEEPEALLRQAIREMQSSLDSAEISLSKSVQRNQELTGRITELEQSIKEIDTQLDLCFESNKEDLARGLVKRKLEANALKKRLDGQQVKLNQSITQQQEALTQNQLSFEHMRQKADALSSQEIGSRSDTPCIDSVLADTGCARVEDADVDVAFLHEKKLRNAS